ncbi:hypothetical protein LOZ80_25935 [Paenibacillus sp. HWE-109]|uniref:hypothetical protein n=1 Tax=Paenibacillus sp. HWE-109 TaxID=1306526 RepID=UPI001EDE1643|nr:hypothetical protein [Paenibacillus sp. HWE-109]UKS25021.1 hypothetical protein LOZ80_25935 [Paenibacillus sp. HWE-109]
MSGINLPTIPADISFEDFVNLVARVLKELQWFTEGNIDNINVRNLKAEKINTGTLNANLVKISAANGSKSFTLDTNGIVANNGTADTLKFDLATGLLTIVSALIQSATGFPKVEINNSTNLLGIYQTISESIRVDPAGTSGNPVLSFFSGGQRKGFMQYLSPDILLATLVGGASITLSSGATLNLGATNLINMSCSNIRINNQNAYNNSFSYVKNVAAGVPTFGTITVTNGIITNVT